MKLGNRAFFQPIIPRDPLNGNYGHCIGKSIKNHSLGYVMCDLVDLFLFSLAIRLLF